jgi:hypothetical protein
VLTENDPVNLALLPGNAIGEMGIIVSIPSVNTLLMRKFYDERSRA